MQHGGSRHVPKTTHKRPACVTQQQQLPGPAFCTCPPAASGSSAVWACPRPPCLHAMRQSAGGLGRAREGEGERAVQPVAGHPLAVQHWPRALLLTRVGAVQLQYKMYMQCGKEPRFSATWGALEALMLQECRLALALPAAPFSPPRTPSQPACLMPLPESARRGTAAAPGSGQRHRARADLSRPS